MALSMQRKSSAEHHPLVRRSLDYFGMPDDRAARMRIYGQIVGSMSLVAISIGAAAVYLKLMAFIW